MKTNTVFLFLSLSFVFLTSSSSEASWAKKCWSYLTGNSEPISMELVGRLTNYDPRPKGNARAYRIKVKMRDNSDLSYSDLRTGDYLREFLISNITLYPKGVRKEHDTNIYRVSHPATFGDMQYTVLAVLQYTDGSTSSHPLNFSRMVYYAGEPRDLIQQAGRKEIRNAYFFIERMSLGVEQPRIQEAEVIELFVATLEEIEGRKIPAVAGISSNNFPGVIYEFRVDFDYQNIP